MPVSVQPGSLLHNASSKPPAINTSSYLNTKSDVVNNAFADEKEHCKCRVGALVVINFIFIAVRCISRRIDKATEQTPIKNADIETNYYQF